MRHRFGLSIVAWLPAGIVCVLLISLSQAACAAGRPVFGLPLAYPAIESGQSLAYQTAMARYEGAAGNAKPAGPPIYDFIPTGQRYRWTWTNGPARLQRVGDGRFMISLADCLAAFCRQIRCEEARWPSFSCSDDRSRMMVVSDSGTVIFGDATYARVTPLPQ